MGTHQTTGGCVQAAGDYARAGIKDPSSRGNKARKILTLSAPPALLWTAQHGAIHPVWCCAAHLCITVDSILVYTRQHGRTAQRHTALWSSAQPSQSASEPAPSRSRLVARRPSRAPWRRGGGGAQDGGAGPGAPAAALRAGRRAAAAGLRPRRHLVLLPPPRRRGAGGAARVTPGLRLGKGVRRRACRD